MHDIMVVAVPPRPYSILFFTRLVHASPTITASSIGIIATTNPRPHRPCIPNRDVSVHYLTTPQQSYFYAILLPRLTLPPKLGYSFSGGLCHCGVPVGGAKRPLVWLSHSRRTNFFVYGFQLFRPSGRSNVPLVYKPLPRWTALAKCSL
jgi:hypothetical protein